MEYTREGAQRTLSEKKKYESEGKIEMVARKPKIIRRWRRKQQSAPSPIQKLIRFVVFLPLIYVFLERIFLFPFEDSTLSGYLDVEKVAVTTTIKKKEGGKIPAAALISSTDTPLKSRKSLEKLTQPFRVTDTSSQCPTKGETNIAGFRHLGTIATTETAKKSITTQQRRIPKILHQQGPSRCVSSVVSSHIDAWVSQLSTDNDDGREWSMFFHTEDAMTRLFRAILVVQGQEKYPTHSILSRIGRGFPHLGQILRNCVDNGSFSKRLLWRFLCLYAYGGMYVDLESSLPSTYDINAKNILGDSHDTVLLWTTVEGDEQDEVGFDPNMIAVSPGHPLMYFAVQHALTDVMTDGYWGETADEKLNKSSQNIVVTNILQRALSDFLTQDNLNAESLDSEKNLNKNLKKTTIRVRTYRGTGNTSVKILDESEVGFSSISDLMKVKSFSSELSGSGGNRGKKLDFSGGNPSLCLFKSLADALQ